MTARTGKLALFDLDGTLLSGDSDFEWGAHLCEIDAVDIERYHAENERFFAQYRAQTLDIAEYLAFALRPLAQYPLSELLAWRRDFVERRIRPLVNPGARKTLDEHRDATTAIITSTNRFITAPIAAFFGVDALLATEPEVCDGRYTGRFAPPACFRENKIDHLKLWMQDTGCKGAETWFYSDSINDLPLLEFVDHPVVVDGDDALARHAEQRGWPQISLR